MRAADAFILPSTSENFGQAVIEAALVGTPVIVTDQCGAAELIQACGCGLVTKADASSLRRAITAMSTKGTRGALSLASADIGPMVDAVTIARRQVEIYQLILEQLPRRRKISQ